MGLQPGGTVCLKRNVHSNVGSNFHTSSNLHINWLPGQGVVKLHGGLVEAEAARGVETTVLGDVA